MRPLSFGKTSLNVFPNAAKSMEIPITDQKYYVKNGIHRDVCGERRRGSASCTDSDRRYRDLGQFFEDRFGGRCPYERSTIAVVGVDVARDRVLQMVDGMEGSASDPAARDGGEEALDGVEPGGRCRGEMERPARMIGEPFENLGLFVGGVIVDDGVDDFSGRNSALDGIEEADELLVAMPSHAAPDHGSIEEVERGEQRGRAVALVVMGHRPAFSGLERQARLRAVERLDLALLVDRDDDRVLGRVHVEADDVLDLLDELRIVGALEGANAVRLQPMRLPQALHGAQADADGFGHGAAGPMRGVARRLGAGQVHNLGDDPGRKRSAAGLARLVSQQTMDALLGVSRLPAPDRGSADARPPRHFLHRQTVGRTKDDVRPPDMFKWAIAIRDNGQQTLAIFAGRKDTDGLSHAHKLAHPPQFVNHPSVSVH